MVRSKPSKTRAMQTMAATQFAVRLSLRSLGVLGSCEVLPGAGEGRVMTDSSRVNAGGQRARAQRCST
ncbi:hypothetical protein ACFFX0_20080 [Citricoccus parietis]|uniref:Uncharacterized protein n=1 Tax=Citricoccus parietis TaxID=592307 RepID=A0ABV5G351_9MICC